MKHRKLRIAWAMVCGIAAVLLVVLWVDSCWSCRYLDTRYYRLEVYGGTFRGVIAVDVDINQTSNFAALPTVFWHFNTFAATKRNFGVVLENQRRSHFGFRWARSGSIYEADTPLWFLTLVATIGATLPWLHWSKRFTLRTLLVAMTLVASALGLIVYAAR